MPDKTGQVEAKLLYDISKLTNISKQIATDFIETMVFTMFKDYLKSMPDQELFLDSFMDFWEISMLEQKNIELDALTNQEGSMLDMAAGAIIANSEDIKAYKNELSNMKDLLRYALTGEE